MYSDGDSPRLPERTDTTLLVQRAQDGDPRALDLLFQRFMDFLRPAVRKRLSPHLRAREEVDDVVNSCLGEAMKSFPRYRKIEGVSIFGWLLTILIRKLNEKRDYYNHRNGNGQEMDELPGSHPTPSEVAARGESLERLWHVLERVGDEQRTIIACRCFLRMPYREIGEILDCSEDAARMRVRRVLTQIEKLYGLS